MKTIAALALAGLLCACSSAPTMQTSFNGVHYTSGPTSINDPRLAQPHFYRNEGDNGWWSHASTPGIN